MLHPWQVLGLGKDEAAPLAKALPAGLPEVAKGPVEGPTPVQDATVAQELLTHLETGPDKAVQYLLERGLCLMPAPLAASVIRPSGQVRKTANDFCIGPCLMLHRQRPGRS
jgi:hypothetical protein